MDMIANEKAKERKAMNEMEVMERAPLGPINDTLMNRNSIAAREAYEADKNYEAMKMYKKVEEDIASVTSGNDYFRGSYIPPNAPFGPHYNAQEAVIANPAGSSVDRADMVHGPDTRKSMVTLSGSAPNQMTNYDLQLARFKSANPHLTEEEALVMDPDPIGLRGIIPGNFDLASLMSPIAKWWENR